MVYLGQYNEGLIGLVSILQRQEIFLFFRVQIVLGAHSAFCTMETEGFSFASGRVKKLTTIPISAECKNSELYFYSPIRLHGATEITFPFRVELILYGVEE
jgi:hypothetical protein